MKERIGKKQKNHVFVFFCRGKVNHLYDLPRLGMYLIFAAKSGKKCSTGGNYCTFITGIFFHITGEEMRTIEGKTVGKCQ